MVNIPMKTSAPYTSQTILSFNDLKVQGAKTSQDIMTLNQNASQANACPTQMPANTHSVGRSMQAAPVQRTPIPVRKPLPSLVHTVRKGQKTVLNAAANPSRIKACLGWNASNADCDVDVSAFLLDASGKVIGDSWFVFYGQTNSPDGSTTFQIDNSTDREIISIDFTKLNPAVSKIVFVLTIHEALQKHLNFSMLQDAYIRILDSVTNAELVSFQMDEYYANVTSMMIGELYLHNGIWKFNAIGNGVARDLAGLCELYGVQVI